MTEELLFCLEPSGWCVPGGGALGLTTKRCYSKVHPRKGWGGMLGRHSGFCGWVTKSSHSDEIFLLEERGHNVFSALSDFFGDIVRMAEKQQSQYEVK